MYIVGMNFSQVLEYVPRHGTMAELGVKRGYNARRMFKQLQPTAMHLVDPWAMEIDPDDPNERARAERAEFDEYYRQTVEWSESEEAEGKVTVTRNYAVEASLQFPDNYFDFIYVDTADTYDGLFGDLSAYGPKMKATGILACDDFYDIRYATHKMKLRAPRSETRALCNLNAANDFCEMYGWEILFITDEYVPDRRPPRFFAGKVGADGDAHRLLDRVLRVTPWAVEVANPRDIRQTMFIPEGSKDVNERRFFTRVL